MKGSKTSSLVEATHDVFSDIELCLFAISGFRRLKQGISRPFPLTF